MRIEIDGEGYPTDEGLRDLRQWKGEPHEIPSLLDSVADAINATGYGRARRRGNVWRMATGGWSGCEDLIGAIPRWVDFVAWRSSHRGGLHVYGVDEGKGANG